MSKPSRVILLAAVLSVAAQCADAAGTGRSAFEAEGAAEISAGFGTSEFSDGWESGGLLSGKGEAALDFRPSGSLRLLAGGMVEGEVGPIKSFARAGGRFLAAVNPLKTWMWRADFSTSASEGADPFRDALRARARVSTELDLVPALFLVSAGYEVESNDFYRIGGYEVRHRAFAETVLMPSLSPLLVLQGGLFGETLLSTVEGDRRSSPGGGLAADLEIQEGLAFSVSAEYRYDLYESGVRAHAVILWARLRAKVSQDLCFFVEYGLDLNGSSAGSEAFSSQRLCAGFKVGR